MDLYCWGTAWVLVTILVACQGQTEEDEKRPYKFAFAIEGYQHRSEEKDERGIIMGEYGFVTGDGVYHVTVYATDENGDFKILSMKNYYVGLPGEGTTAAPSRASPSPTLATTPPPPSTTKSPILQHLEGLMGCSGCIVPDKSKNGKKPGAIGGPPPNSDGEGLIDERFGGSPGKPSSLSPGTPELGALNPASNGKPSGGNAKQPFGVGGSPNSFGGSGPASGVPGGRGPPGKGSPQYNTPSGGQIPQRPGPDRPSSQGYEPPPKTSGDSYSEIAGDRFGEMPLNQGGSVPGRPQSQGPESGSLPGTNQFSRPGSSFSGNLPPGMSMEDLMALLYKFNYTLKYHGHHESGYRNGDKEGGYFFNGRDGMGRNVKYIANEFGFQPNITLVDLGLNSPDTPKEENEEPDDLKGYEFKWFYNR